MPACARSRWSVDAVCVGHGRINGRRGVAIRGTLVLAGAAALLSWTVHSPSHAKPSDCPGDRVDRIYIDVAPLQEAEYTGIPQVAAKLAEQLLGDAAVDPAFFYNRHEVPPRIVEELLRVRSGKLFRWAAERYCMPPALRRPPADGRVMGLHTNMKFARRVFPIEGQIVHDLTTVVTPHFHTEETNRYHVEKFYGDLHSNDVTFCVSQSTATDVQTFYRGLPGPVVVSHLGVDWDHIDADTQAWSVDSENYILVLGTLEPRKNVSDLLDLLAERPQIARMYRFVFGGRIGWGDSFEQQVLDRGLGRLLSERRIVQTGFVSETAKYLLFKHASAVVYPSVYEGFGLPVAEAISLGVPIVTTASSSLPEVGRDFAHYFVPEDLESLGTALQAALRYGRIEDGSALDAWRRHFSWRRCYSVIKNGLQQAADVQEAAHVRN